ncbi:DNA polymerase [Labeo rohita]|uniref:DNA-directed DNA polymerase n=1 Tax=Labeo rohita TaxID=84645 RepID=A0ABQ8L6C5_LABRO|nr:DNA polymerase [Labeo rohita]
MKYRKAFIDCTELDPFNFTTLASCCMGVFKTHYLDRDTLALTHNIMYVQHNKTYSNASIEWLEYVKYVHGEVQIGRYFLDGYYELNGERDRLGFCGCFWHGCERCYEPHNTHPLSIIPFGVPRRQFDDKVEILQNAYRLKIEVLWGCEWNKLKRTDPSVMEFMSTYSAPERLKPRDSLYCGRCGYTVVPRPYFNGLELHRVLNLREISSTDLAAYTMFVQNVLSEMVTFSRQMAGQGGFINLSLKGPSLKCDVNAVLSPGNDYNEQVFVDQFEAVMQSNEGVMADDSLQLHVSIARRLKLKIVMQGCRLVFMFDETAKQRYIDSYSFLPMALAKTSAAFNLTTTEKGYFPHLFNRLENQSFVGPYPSKYYYGYNNMSDSARAKFDQWYDTLAGKIFDFRKEIAPERLKPRDALFGGRTNAYKLYHKVADGEKVRYVDFTSLYPYCQARKSYPIGHPEIIHSDFENIENYYGLIKVKMLPPQKLLHPVLPSAPTDKLMFPLCRTCAETQSKVLPCTHTDDERAISGTWVSLELLKAIEKGYVVVKVYEASGYPSDVITDADKRAYIEDYHKKGIKLDEKIAHNPAQRSVMKLLLNSLWGRFSLRENLPTSKLLTNPEDFAHFIFGCQYEIKYFTFLSDNVALVQYHHAEGSFYETRDVNVFIGAFTTAHARLELYNLMDKLGDRLLYSNTDSVIYVSREGDWEPPLGPYLGELTDEVGSDDFITEYCSSGPKTYGYSTAKGKVCMKAKGITLNSENSKVIRLDSLISLVHSYVNSSDSTRHILAHTDNITASDEFIIALCELALNVLHGNVPLTSQQYQKLKRRKAEITFVANKKMEFTDKMYIVPQHQLDRLRTSNQRESLQQVVENDLDTTIRNILHKTNLDPYEKAKLYTAVLQRYLTMARLGDMETNTLTLSLPTPDGANNVQQPTSTPDIHDATDVVMDEVLKNVPQRNVKNIQYILDKMSKTKDNRFMDRDRQVCV